MPIYYLTVLYSEVLVAQLVSVLRVSLAENNVSGSVGSYAEAWGRIHFQALSGFCNNSIPYGVRTFPFWLSARGHSQLPKDYPDSLPCARESLLLLNDVCDYTLHVLICKNPFLRKESRGAESMSSYPCPLQIFPLGVQPALGLAHSSLQKKNLRIEQGRGKSPRGKKMGWKISFWSILDQPIFS